MYKDPITHEVIPTHPLELPRVEGYRKHGFDELDLIHDWVLARLGENNEQPFGCIHKTQKHYVSLVVERPELAEIPHFLINLEVGYVDFQDGELIKQAGLQYCLYVKSKLITVIAASDDQNRHVVDIHSLISEVASECYLSIPINKI